MKKGIHPELKTATVKCACGHTFETLSVKDKITVEICAKCHPIFTGKKNALIPPVRSRSSKGNTERNRSNVRETH
jgi:large subunit ribosomal protein L31